MLHAMHIPLLVDGNFVTSETSSPKLGAGSLHRELRVECLLASVLILMNSTGESHFNLKRSQLQVSGSKEAPSRARGKCGRPVSRIGYSSDLQLAYHFSSCVKLKAVILQIEYIS